MHVYFEQGLYRPPSEAASLLLRFTRNCPWNKCTFCPLYKGRLFSRRSLKEIKADIDAVRSVIDDVERLRASIKGSSQELERKIISRIFTDPGYNHGYRHVARWYLSNSGTVFLQDANNLIMSTSELVEALRYLKENIPCIRRITSYGRSSTIARKSLEELKEIHDAGLDRIHIGLESGSDNVLRFVKKGATAAQHIKAGRKVVEAGITLSEYIMPGLGGRTWSREHALETAKVLNEIDPHFIRIRSLRIPKRTPLYEDMVSGRFHPLTDDEVVKELRLLIESLDNIHSVVTSDHIMNLLEEVAGQLPEDKERMLQVIDEYLALSDRDRLLFRLGRRGGALRSTRELNNPRVRERLEEARKDLESRLGKDIEVIIKELADQYI